MASPPTRNLFAALTGANSGTTYTPDLSTLASGASVGDWIVVSIATDGNPTLSLGGTSAADGWSIVTQLSDATNACSHARFRFIVVTAGTIPSLDISLSASEAIIGQGFRIRPATAGNIINVITPTTASGSSTNPNPASITNTTGATQGIYYLVTWGGDTGTVTSTVAPTNYANHQSVGQSNAANGCSIGSADRSIASVANSTVEDPATFTRATEQWVTITSAFYEVPPPAPVWSSSTTASVAENATLAYTCAASDTTSYSLVGGADQARFEISGTTLRWLSNGTKDYETPNDSDSNNTYVVTVRATGAGGTTDQTITVTVTDVTNPNITNSATVNVDENALLSHSLTVSSGSPTWTIVGGADSTKFEINSATLSWAAAGTKNYDSPDDANADNIYVVTVRATSGTEFSEQTISVTVVDKPTPVITSSNAVNVAENAQLSHNLTTSTAGTPTWSLVGGTDQAKFNLLGSNLRWAGNGTKNYEAPDDSNTDNVYQVTVRCNIAGETADQTINVTVTDNPTPVITSSASVNVAENDTLAHNLTTSSGSPTWEIVGGTDSSKFEISINTLHWVANGTKNYEAPDDSNTDNVYQVTVRATINGETADQTINVTVTNISPVFTSSATPSNVENTTLSHTLAVSGGGASFAIVGGADQARFEISGTTLRWAGNGTKDYEAPNDANTDNVYEVTVRATQSGETSDQNITVTVTNDALDDDVTAPTITSRNTYVISPRKAWSTTLTANESVTWTKTGGADQAQFTLTGDTLSLGAKGPKTTWVVQVTATDPSSNQTPQTITVNTTKARRRSRGY